MLTDRTCLVTGASRGIGRGIAEAFGEAGADVAVNFHYSSDAANQIVRDLRDQGTEAIAVQADVTDRDQVETMLDTVHEELGPPDVLVNNAGITVDTKFEHMTRDEWDRVMDVNLGGVFNCTQACFSDIKHADEGRIITISSVIGQLGNYGQANYAASKSGLFGFTRSIALELAPHGATANCVAPGYTETDMLVDVDEKILAAIREGIPLGRFATPAEIAAVVRFLASRESSYVTGEVIDVNGAMDLA